MENWSDMLAAARTRLRLTQAELAALTHISANTIKAYEAGRRHPSRPYLVAMLDALKIGREERNRILLDAGYASDGYEIGPWVYGQFMFTSEEAAAFIEGYDWPAFLLTEMMDLAAANAAAQRLWHVDLTREFLEPGDRNLLSVVSDPRFGPRLANMPEALRVMASVFRGHHRGAETLDDPSPVFGAMLERFMTGDRAYLQMLLEAWQDAVPRTPKIRWEYPVVWSDPDVGTLRFRALVNPAAEPDGLAFNDWIPLDAQTWDGLRRLEDLYP
jgi:transcriptional regulator with XRE-family HTH domain